MSSRLGQGNLLWPVSRPAAKATVKIAYAGCREIVPASLAQIEKLPAFQRTVFMLLSNEAVMLQHLTILFQRAHQVANNYILFHKKTSNHLTACVCLHSVVPLEDFAVSVQSLYKVTHNDIFLHDQ